jgi:putative transposase
MPWKKTQLMTEKEHFVTLAQTGHFTVGELCADFGISRKTGHKYLKRYRCEGFEESRKRVSPSIADF